MGRVVFGETEAAPVLPPAVLGEEVRRVDEVSADGFPEGFGGSSGEEGVGGDGGREVEGAGEMGWVADAGEEGETEPASGRGERVVRMGRFGEHDGRFQLVLCRVEFQGLLSRDATHRAFRGEHGPLAGVEER